MQASLEESKLTSSPSLSTPEFSEQFNCKMKLLDVEDPPRLIDDDDEEEEEQEEEEEFTFACVGSEEDYTVSADEAFHDGQIKTVFPLFDQSLLLDRDSAPGREDLARRPSVKKVFIEAEDSPSPSPTENEIERLDGENPAGMYCPWSRKAVEASPETCKKSNSTGFSKLWRFREFTNRSNSDGRDAFVFLNNNNNNNKESKTASCSNTEEKSKVKANSDEGKGKAKAKAKKKGETSSLSAHEMHYVRNRALKEGDKRRSYLPYKPGVVGFFTNVNGGLSRNVHPF